MSEVLEFLCAQAVLPRWVLAASWIAFIGILVCERLVLRRWQDNWKAENEWAIGLSNERDYWKAVAERRGAAIKNLSAGIAAGLVARKRSGEMLESGSPYKVANG